MGRTNDRGGGRGKGTAEVRATGRGEDSEEGRGEGAMVRAGGRQRRA